MWIFEFDSIDCPDFRLTGIGTVTVTKDGLLDDTGLRALVTVRVPDADEAAFRALMTRSPLNVRPEPDSKPEPAKPVVSAWVEAEIAVQEAVKADGAVK